MLTFLFISTLYLLFLRNTLGFNETLKYLYAFLPVFFLMGGTIVLFNRFYSFQKGISGEKIVEDILKKYKIDYQQDIKNKDKNFDYDFIFVYQNNSYLLEVKNYSYLDTKTVKKHLFWINHNVKELRKESFIQTESIIPILIYTDKQPPDKISKLIKSPAEFEVFIKNLVIN